VRQRLDPQRGTGERPCGHQRVSCARPQTARHEKTQRRVGNGEVTVADREKVHRMGGRGEEAGALRAPGSCEPVDGNIEAAPITALRMRAYLKGARGRLPIR